MQISINFAVSKKNGMNVKTIDLGNIAYSQAWDIQKQYFEELIKAKQTGVNNPVNYFLFCEHPHVYTIGKSGQQSNLLINNDFLNHIKASVFHIDRGGDITYHGPGQIVGYPIIDLEAFQIGVKEYVEKLEESIMLTLSDFGIQSSRLSGATGVWIDVEKSGMTRKICAIGIKASRYVTMHGFALNVNTDLSYFNHINPCGFVDKGVTSMQKELGREISMDEVKTKIIYYFAKVFSKAAENQ